MERQESKTLSYKLLLGKIDKNISKKNGKYPIFGPFLPKFGQKLIFNKNWTPSLFSIFSLTSCKKSVKNNELILRKTLN